MLSSCMPRVYHQHRRVHRTRGDMNLTRGKFACKCRAGRHNDYPRERSHPGHGACGRLFRSTAFGSRLRLAPGPRMLDGRGACNSGEPCSDSTQERSRPVASSRAALRKWWNRFHRPQDQLTARRRIASAAYADAMRTAQSSRSRETRMLSCRGLLANPCSLSQAVGPSVNGS